MEKRQHRQKEVLMTEGPIWRCLLLFALPLMAGNLFQQLYNTVDSIVVGNFVGKEALAAVGSTDSVINTFIGFFSGMSTGHACQEEIKLIYTLVHPKYAIPVHGEYKHLKAQAGIAQELGIQKENIFILRSGNVLELNEEKAGVTGQVAAGAILVDGLGIGDVGNVVLRDRQHLAEDGIMIVVVALDSISGQIASGPDLVSRGFVYVKESDALMDEARDLMENVMEGCVSRGCTDWGRIKTAIKDNLGDFIWKKTKRRPMILPIIMEV